MARKKRQRQKLRRAQRVKSLTSLDDYRLRSRFYKRREPLNDLRRYRPYESALTVSGMESETTLDEYEKTKRQTKARISFVDPKRVTVCLRRKIRRSILFAEKKAGKGKSIRTPKRLNTFSKFKC